MEAKIELDIHDKRIHAGGKIKGKFKISTRAALNDCELAVHVRCQEYIHFEKMGKDAKEENELIDIIPAFTKKAIDNKHLDADKTYDDEFEVKIPDSAPASFELDFGGTRGYIRYLVEVTFKSKEVPSLYVRKKVTVKERFEKKQELDTESWGLVLGICYTNKGKLKMFCDMASDDVADIKEEFEGTLTVDAKECLVGISHLNARFYEVCSMHAGGRNFSKERDITLWDIGSCTEGLEKKIPFSHKMPYNQGFLSFSTSLKGKFMKREYYMSIVPKFNEFICCAPSIKIPFQITYMKSHKKKK